MVKASIKKNNEDNYSAIISAYNNVKSQLLSVNFFLLVLIGSVVNSKIVY